MNAKEENTPEKVWDYLMKLSEEFKELGKKLDKTDQIVNGIAKSNGDMAEDTIYNALEQDMTFAGIEFNEISKNIKRKDTKNNIRTELDVLLTNGDTIAVIETKYKVRKNDVEDLVTTKAVKFRKLFSEFNNYKLLLGIGGMSFEDDAIDEAENNGVGIIKIIGDKVEYHTEGIKTY